MFSHSLPAFIKHATPDGTQLLLASPGHGIGYVTQ